MCQSLRQISLDVMHPGPSVGNIFLDLHNFPHPTRSHSIIIVIIIIIIIIVIIIIITIIIIIITIIIVIVIIIIILPISYFALNCWFAPDVRAAMLDDKNKSISLLWELNSI